MRLPALFLDAAKLLNVNRFHHFFAVGHRGLLESLAATEFFNNAGFFEFAFEFLKSPFYELAFFYLYNNHILGVGSFICV